VRLASRGQRDLDTGPQAISDAAELTQVRRRARAVYLKSFVAAAVLTGFAFVI